MSLPLVTAIMPIKARRAFVSDAIAGFLAQTYPAKELLIVEDGPDDVRDLIPASPEIRYERLARVCKIGAKRNICCSRAAGEIIIHLDSDDWYAPTRIAEQVRRHLESGAAVTGYRTMAFADDATRRAWRYLGAPGHAMGNSLCYSRKHWAAKPFPDHLDYGEDAAFVKLSRSVRSWDDDGLIVARVHHGNTCQRAQMLNGSRWTGACGQVWQEIPYEQLAQCGYPVVDARTAEPEDDAIRTREDRRRDLVHVHAS